VIKVYHGVLGASFVLEKVQQAFSALLD